MLLRHLLHLQTRLMDPEPGTSGSTSAPTSTPTASEPSTSTSTEPSGGGFDFEALANYTDEAPSSPTSSEAGALLPTETPTSQPAQPTTPPSASAATVTPSPVQPAPASTQGAAPQQSPQGQPQVQSTEAAPQQATQPATPSATSQPTAEQIAQSFKQHREQFLPQLEQLYKIEGNWDSETIDELRTNPEKVLPKLAANLHYEVQLATYNSVMQALPNVVSTIIDQRRAVDRYTDMFKQMYPQLHEKKEYEAAAENAIRVIRQTNPQLPMEEVLKRAGVAACLALGLQLPASVVQPATPPPAPASPPPRIPPPGRPAGIGAASSVIPPASPDDAESLFGEIVDAVRQGIA